MSLVNYVKCDVCGNTLHRDNRVKGFTDGWRFKLGNLFNRFQLDICDKCFDKLQKLSYETKIEDIVCSEVIENSSDKFSDTDTWSVYLQGVEDTLNCLGKHRMNKIKEVGIFIKEEV